MRPVRAITEIRREALRLFDAYQAARASSLASLRFDLAKGIADVRAGRVHEPDVKAIKARGRASLTRTKAGT